MNRMFATVHSLYFTSHRLKIIFRKQYSGVQTG